MSVLRIISTHAWDGHGKLNLSPFQILFLNVEAKMQSKKGLREVRFQKSGRIPDSKHYFHRRVDLRLVRISNMPPVEKSKSKIKKYQNGFVYEKPLRYGLILKKEIKYTKQIKFNPIQIALVPLH